MVRVTTVSASCLRQDSYFLTRLSPAVQVHARWVKLWAKRILATPEQALVPLKERDQMLASKHEVSPGDGALAGHSITSWASNFSI